MNRRVVAARVALVLAAVLLPLGMLSSWSSAILSDDDRYVEEVAPLAGDRAVQKAVISHLTEEAMTMFEPDPGGPCGATSSEPAESPLGGFGDLAEAFLPYAEGPIRAIVTGIVEGPGFERAWTGANRSAHDQLIGVLEGDDSNVDGAGCVSIDLSEVIQEAVPELRALGGFGLTLPETQTPVASLSADDLGTARVAYAVLNPLGFWLPVLWFVSVLAAFLLSTRRWRTLALLGAASAVGMLLLVVGLSLTRSSLVDASGDPEVAGAVWDAVASSIRNGALLLLVLSLVGTAVGGFFTFRPLFTADAPDVTEEPRR